MVCIYGTAWSKNIYDNPADEHVSTAISHGLY